MFEWSRDGLAIICAAVLSIAGSAASAADEVRVYKSFSVNDGPSVECATPLLFDEGEPITIDVTPNPNCCDPVDPCCCGVVTMIRIVAQGGAPNYTLHNLGPITVTGSRFFGEELLVLVAGYDDSTQNEVLEFPTFPQFPLAPGAHHWAGITAEGDVRHEVILAASITGNLDGPTGSKVSVGGGWPRSLQSENSCHPSPVPPAIGACLPAGRRADEGCRWRGEALRASHR